MIRSTPCRGCSCRQGAVVLVGVSLLVLMSSMAASATKWTIFIYMVADNDLECFAIDNLSVS